MDHHFSSLPFSVDDSSFESQVPLPNPKRPPNYANGFDHNEPAAWFDSLPVPLLPSGLDSFDNAPAFPGGRLCGEMAFPAEHDRGDPFDKSSSLGSGMNAGGESPSSDDIDNDPSDPVLKYISQMLMEENIEDKVWFFPNDIALRNTEKSLYDALGEQYPDLPDQSQNFHGSQSTESPSSSLSGNSSEKSSVGTTITRTSSSYCMDSSWLHDPGAYNQGITSTVHPLGQVPQSNFGNNSPFYVSSLSCSTGDINGPEDSFVFVKNPFCDNDSVLQFQRGLEEASKFLPPSSQLIIDFEKVSSGSGAKRGTPGVDVHDSEGGREDALGGSKGRKNHERDDLGLEERRATKQSASYAEADEAELSDMLDKVLLWTDKEERPCSTASCLPTDARNGCQIQTVTPVREISDRRGWGRRQETDSPVDLRALLIQCAQAISSNDLRTANELLKQIRENSSPEGDGFQRLAHYFANGLDARMAGNDCETQCFHASIANKRRSVADVLKAFQLHLLCCPFKRISIAYMNHMIWKLSREASVLHIIDFGVGFGFQWPILIQKLGEQAGGPPKLRITGIELPQPGLRPAEGIEETGRRLARYCGRFNVPFEYSALPSRNWEDIKIEDLKIKNGEIVAVNCLMRFRNIPDETGEEDSPRDAVLNLIRRIKADIFVNASVNASYSAPFFVTRFREALFHLSSIYDMLDATIPSEYRDSEERMVLESEFYGREVMNVVACEGADRVERPESYKNWQIRHARAGFKQLPLDQAMMKKFRQQLKASYHRDFVLDEDGCWMLMGWKGRIIYATTCWVPI